MKHRHVGPLDVACTGCLREAKGDPAAAQARRLVWGLVLLIGFVILCVGLLAYYASQPGPRR